MFSAIEISATGLEARRVWMNTIAENIANAETTRDAAGNPQPYRRQQPLFRPDPVGRSTGVTVADIVPDYSEFKSRYLPGHPDADAEGIVKFPNVNVVQEMVDMLMASRSYEANVTAIETTKSMFSTAAQILA